MGHHLDRRDFVHLGALGAAGLALGRPEWLRAATRREMDPVGIARAAARWIASHRMETAAGLKWPRIPGEDEGGDISLYHGAPGPILFLLELHDTTGDASALADARAGADELLAVLERDAAIDPGLYSGLSGMAYTLALVGSVSGEVRYERGARECIGRIVSGARETESGVAWFADAPENASNDIISGASGIGYTLLWYGASRGDDAAVETAVAAARHLATLGIDAPTGRKWRMMPSYERLMPNFSHGTAGVSAFLARAGAVSGEGGLIEAAIEGTRYLESVAVCEDGGCRVFHHEPEGEDLFYLSWCHGPAGTARAFHEVARATGDRAAAAWLERGGRGIQGMGVPERRSPGYWNNISQCCGDCGVGEFFLALHALSGDDAHLAYARRIAGYVAGRADEPGAAEERWTQAENRVQPELLQAQTGLMQGAAGVGAFYLHLAAREAGRSPLVVLPDTPWADAL